MAGWLIACTLLGGTAPLEAVRLRPESLDPAVAIHIPGLSRPQPQPRGPMFSWIEDDDDEDDDLIETGPRLRASKGELACADSPDPPLLAIALPEIRVLDTLPSSAPLYILCNLRI